MASKRKTSNDGGGRITFPALLVIAAVVWIAYHYLTTH